MDKFHEKRKFQRMFFTVDDGIYTSLLFPEQDNTSVTTNILSISEGGLSFILHKEAIPKVNDNEQVVLEKILEPEIFSFLKDVKVEIRHSISDNELNHIICGCQFLEINDSIKDDIRLAMGSLNRIPQEDFTI